tara:strand:+ start:3955 stop:5178 length:1224 start_codon:yes stop_codon:yes gene_type:complete
MAKASKKHKDEDGIFGELTALNPFGTSSFGTDDTYKNNVWIDTGSWILNAAMSGSIKKGIPGKKITALVGESGSGKTFLVLNAVMMAQRMGYTPIYYDTEGAIDPDSCRTFGIDLENFHYQPVSDVDLLKSMYAVFIKNLKELKVANKPITKKYMLILDSVGMLASAKEIEDARTQNSAADMTRAKSLRSFFRIITSDLNSLEIPMIFTNHVGVNIGGYGDPVVQGGGGGVLFSPSVTLFLSKAKLKDDKDDDKKQTGVVVTAKTGKNRFAQPKVIKFPIFFNRPFNKYAGVQDYFSWEGVGIAKGNIITKGEYNKLKGPAKEKVKPFTPTGSEDVMYFSPKDTAQKFIVEHLGEAVSTRELWTSRVFDPLEDRFDVLIRKDFEFGSQEIEDEINGILDDEEDLLLD